MVAATMQPMDTIRLTPSALGGRVEARRISLKMDQADLARRSELSRSYISRLEHGGVLNPKINDLDRVAQALSWTLSELLSTEADDDGYRTYRFSADIESIQREIKNLPDEVAESVLRTFHTALDIVNSTRKSREN